MDNVEQVPHHHIVIINHYEDEDNERMDFTGHEDQIKSQLLNRFHWLYEHGGMAADLSTFLHAINNTQVYSVYEKVGDEWEDEAEVEKQ